MAAPGTDRPRPPLAAAVAHTAKTTAQKSSSGQLIMLNSSWIGLICRRINDFARPPPYFESRARQRFFAYQHRPIAQFAIVHAIFLDPPVQRAVRNSRHSCRHHRRQHVDLRLARRTHLALHGLARRSHKHLPFLNRDRDAPSGHTDSSAPLARWRGHW